MREPWFSVLGVVFDATMCKKDVWNEEHDNCAMDQNKHDWLSTSVGCVSCLRFELRVSDCELCSSMV